jgi:hypothetical protein
MTLGDSKIDMFSFKGIYRSAITIQDIGAEAVPVLEYTSSGEVRIIEPTDAKQICLISEINIVQARDLMGALGAFISEAESSMRLESRQNSVNRIRRRIVNEKENIGHTDKQDYNDFDGFSSNPHYNDNLDMNQQSQEFWDSL